MLKRFSSFTVSGCYAVFWDKQECFVHKLSLHLCPHKHAKSDTDDETLMKLDKIFFDVSFSFQSLQNKAIEFSPNLSNQKWKFFAAPSQIEVQTFTKEQMDVVPIISSRIFKTYRYQCFVYELMQWKSFDGRPAFKMHSASDPTNSAQVMLGIV